jgi:signal recognition particle subunit SEC65
MSVQWIIAKYIPDMMRREPENIGVILLKDGKPYLRFRDRDADGNIDGRRARWHQNSVENYKAWISHWERAAVDGDARTLLSNVNPNSNFFLEFGGERILGSATTDPDLFLDELFRQLVGAEDPTSLVISKPKREAVIERIFKKLDIFTKVERDQVLPGTTDEDCVIFDFKYKNGKNTWMKHVALGRSEKLVWEPLHSAAWAFDSAAKADRGCKLVALLTHQDVDPNPVSVGFLAKHCGKVIDVSDDERADKCVEGLRTVLGLS